MSKDVIFVSDFNYCRVCGKFAEANEYDSDEDMYLMICEDGHKHWVTDDTETWK